MRPEPSLTFTVPSIRDGTAIQCRAFHPPRLNPVLTVRGTPSSSSSSTSPTTRWIPKAAIMAHPYAPLGGSYDDPVVEIVTSRLLENNFLVGTFNFRGAGSSAGRTSWTAKAELDDYASFVGFLAYYLHFISPTRHTNGDSSDVDSLQQVPTGISPSVPHDAPIFLIGGYSYGSMIASKLTSLRDVLQMFTSPPASSNAAQIRLQAECLAGQQSGLSSCARNALSYRHQPGYCTDTATINGTMRTPEPVLGPQDLRRNSCVGRGKVMPLMDSVDATAAKTGEELRANSFEPNHQVHTPHRAGRRNRSASVMTSKAGRLPAVSDFTIPREAYLLVSPIPGIMTRLTTMSLLPSALTRSQDVSDRDGKIACYPTLAVFGDQDCFVSAAKLRSWAARLKGLPDSKFQAKEVSKAGHFWIEHGAIASLHVLVDEFVKGLTGDMASLDKPR